VLHTPISDGARWRFETNSGSGRDYANAH
jgi:hypothetical protein